LRGLSSLKLGNLNYRKLLCIGRAAARHRSRPTTPKAKRCEGIRIHGSPYTHPADDGGKRLHRHGTEQLAAGARPLRHRRSATPRSRLSILATWGQACRLIRSAGQRRFQQVAIVGGPGRTDTHIRRRHPSSHHGSATTSNALGRRRTIGSRGCGLIMSTAWLAECCTEVSWAIEPVMALDGTRAPHRKQRGSEILHASKK
jgi:hypothetical protein